MLQYQCNFNLSNNQSISSKSSQNAPLTPQALREKIEKILEKAVSFKIAQKKIAVEMGFDSSKEVFIKGE